MVNFRALLRGEQQQHTLGVLVFDGSSALWPRFRAQLAGRLGARIHPDRARQSHDRAYGAYLSQINEELRADPSEPAAVASRFLAAFSAAEFESMRALLAEDVVAYITNARGRMDRVEGRNAYLDRLEAMDLPSAQFSVELTQPPVSVGPDQVLVMVEIHAHREGRSLHNFAAHLLRIADGRITDWRVVDAKPSESDEFWA